MTLTSDRLATPATPKAPLRLGFLLMDNFTLISLASAVEPLRMANQLAGRELYQWTTLSADGEAVRASDGLLITPDNGMHDPLELDMVFVCGGVGIQRHVTREHVLWLQSQARQSRRVGAICTGSWALAQAGLLDGYECSIHWEFQAAAQEAYPHATLTTRLFSIDRDRATASGGTAPLDMMLTLIARDHGRELSAAISDMFICDRVRGEQDQQRVPLRHVLGTSQPKLLEIVALMEANLEEPIALDELARYVDVSRRQLERLFQKYLSCSPSRYYLKLRLTRARQLLRQTSMSIIEIASVCGFVSTPHFSKCYREYFGTPPRDERVTRLNSASVTLAPATPSDGHDPYVAPRASSAMQALAQAQGEPTYASVRLV
ncbi:MULTISPECIES: GlxA family transcriptional regulator [Chromohalobacter]|uniref:choline metabolism transcriptional regulator GbdR n=1 Tax=Chromohalobacter TaxID=42054 RepID=UPI0015C4A34F|nr:MULTISPECIES: GlxA family transcriptional regulator [Chromohalobacter]MBZ5875592.1 GlxA family transcriptional regulator [Chromohalobacter salexigens]MDO0944418.1 GlxA family transcriptional regulator [Chromohalobacter salexigens]NQY45996.1 GlxA family transcriptional regulator [Chromohalobacter sp.]NWO55778.1 AraC family transcriptional regulator [Chromohalobacter salexigens]